MRWRRESFLRPLYSGGTKRVLMPRVGTGALLGEEASSSSAGVGEGDAESGDAGAGAGVAICLGLCLARRGASAAVESRGQLMLGSEMEK